MVATSTASLACLCGAISTPATILADPSLPISTGICHCSACRYTTGTLGASFPPLGSSPPQDTLSKLTAYHSSEQLVRYFCSTCGCHCFCVVRSSEQWYCLGGIIESSPSAKANNIPWPKDTIKISSHRHILDTLDGGITPFLLNLDGRSLPTWSGAPHHGPQAESFVLPHASILELPSKSISTVQKPDEGAYLGAKCHCGGVSLLIKRANYKLNPASQEARYITSDGAKYLTYFCSCRSCRLSTGVSMLAWSLVPPENIFNANAPVVNGDHQSIVFGFPASEPTANPGLTLKHHWSSPDVCRSFCEKCGATISYWCGQRPTELDLTVGILRSEEGSMARQWLEWEWGRCSFTEESIDREASEAWSGCAELMKTLGG